MLATPDHRTTPLDRETTERPAHESVPDLRPRTAGVGALVFVVTVVIQNVLRGALAPQSGAAVQDVMRYYADHRSVSVALSVTFVLSGIGLVVFLGGVMRRLLAGPRRAWAFTGFAGALGIVVLFSTMVAAESALSVLAARPEPSAGAIDAIWALHNGVFAALFLSIGVALLGLARSGVAAEVTPSPFEWLAPAGFALLALGAAGGPLLAGGDAMALFALAGIGFLIWLAFLVATGARLVRRG